MTNGEWHSDLAKRAIAMLTLISILGIVGGIIVAFLGQPIGAIIAIVTGAVGGIVAITIRQFDKNGNGK